MGSRIAAPTTATSRGREAGTASERASAWPAASAATGRGVAVTVAVARAFGAWGGRGGGARRHQALDQRVAGDQRGRDAHADEEAEAAQDEHG
ncbi:hypothetical protein, partial [Streptomyces sp. NPDC054952]